MRTFYSLLDEVLVRAGTSSTATTDGIYTDSLLREWTDQSHKWAAGFHKWPAVEGRSSSTYSATADGRNLPEGYKPDSIRTITVGGARLQKVPFNDYLKYLEDNSSTNARIYSDWGPLYFINTNADVSGTIVFYGQYTPAAWDKTDSTLTTVFTDAGDEDAN